MIELYHYTNKVGYDAVTSGRVGWQPSIGLSAKPIEIKSKSWDSEDFTTVDPSQIGDKILSALTLGGIALATIGFAAPDPFDSAFTIGNPLMPPTTLINDINYGPGWYATNLTPDTKSEILLNELWQGNINNIDKLNYWLKLSLDIDRFKTPDKNRPYVKFLPIVNRRKMSGDPPRPCGQSTSVVLLVEAGSRTQASDETIKVDFLYKPSPALVVIKPFIFLIEGFSKLNSIEQNNIRRYFQIDNDE